MPGPGTDEQGGDSLDPGSYLKLPLSYRRASVDDSERKPLLLGSIAAILFHAGVSDHLIEELVKHVTGR
jgi:hypothetical protein